MQIGNRALIAILLLVFTLGLGAGRMSLPDKSAEIASLEESKLKAESDLKEALKSHSEESGKSTSKLKTYYPSGVLKSEKDISGEFLKKHDEELTRSIRKSINAELAKEYRAKIVENAKPNNLVSGWATFPIDDFLKFKPSGYGASYQYRWIANTFAGIGYEQRVLLDQTEKEIKTVGSYLF